jgi:hypothetical protein
MIPPIRGPTSITGEVLFAVTVDDGAGVSPPPFVGTDDAIVDSRTGLEWMVPLIGMVVAIGLAEFVANEPGKVSGKVSGKESGKEPGRNVGDIVGLIEVLIPPPIACMGSLGGRGEEE